MIAAALLALIPLLHRLGSLVGPLAFAVVGYAIIFTICSMVGTDTGMPMQYLVAAAIMVLILGADHLAISVALTVLAALLIIALELLVPADTGIRSTAHTLISLIANVVGSSAILFAIVLYAVRDAARAEAAAEREYDRTKSLLTSILPRAVAERLKLAPGAILVDKYVIRRRSVLPTWRASPPSRARFRLSTSWSALNRVFGEFDRLVGSYGLEKIKTSGDAYMVVGGVPRSRPDHAEVLADFALAMRDMAMTLPNSQGRPTLRIGMASGPVVAGVIGTSKMFYDVWGDAVNVASRMESTGPQGQIRVSPGSYELLKDKFILDKVAPSTSRARDRW